MVVILRRFSQAERRANARAMVFMPEITPERFAATETEALRAHLCAPSRHTAHDPSQFVPFSLARRVADRACPPSDSLAPSACCRDEHGFAVVKEAVRPAELDEARSLLWKWLGETHYTGASTQRNPSAASFCARFLVNFSLTDWSRLQDGHATHGWDRNDPTSKPPREQSPFARDFYITCSFKLRFH